MATQIKDMPENNQEARDKKEALLERAKAAGLDKNATRAEVLKAEGREAHSDADSEAPAAAEQKIKHMAARNSKENDERNAWIDRAKAVGLDARATQAEVEAAESGEPKSGYTGFRAGDLILRARRAGLQDGATLQQISAAEASRNGNPVPDARKVDLINRARLSGLTDTATLEQVVAAEKVKGIDYSKKTKKAEV